MKKYYKVVGKTCYKIHSELRKISELINPTSNKQYSLQKLMTKRRRYALIKSICERLNDSP